MSEDIRKMIDKVKNFKQFVNESLSTAELGKSVFSLTKNNNGLFKSEAQAKFLISQIDNYQGLVGYANSGYNSIPIFAEYDEKGITKLVKRSNDKSLKDKDVVVFERKNDNGLNTLEIKELNTLKRNLKKLETQLNDKVNSWESGNYNGSGDKSTYDTNKATVERYEYFKNELEKHILSLKDTIKSLENKRDF
jgi:hypothetical protein